MNDNKVMNNLKRVVVNADDCGMSKTVNEHIEKAILAGKITSTTIIVNMDDYEGAVALYKKYCDRISFGWHINLTEGKPLLKSQLLLDCGFYIETDNGVKMNGRKFMHKWLPSKVRLEIKKELMAQHAKLQASGINISHVDSHHHVHTSTWAVNLIPSLLNETGIKAMRCMFNNKPMSLDFLLRKGWMAIMKLQVRGLRMPNVLSGFQQFVEEGIIPNGNIIELECHPGHPKYSYEEELMMNQSYSANYRLISYNQI